MGPKAERHFTPIDGRMRFYANGHGYFVVGEKIRYSGVYEGVEIGAVADAHYASKHDKRVLYRIRFQAPEGPPRRPRRERAPAGHEIWRDLGRRAHALKRKC